MVLDYFYYEQNYCFHIKKILIVIPEILINSSLLSEYKEYTSIYIFNIGINVLLLFINNIMYINVSLL